MRVFSLDIVWIKRLWHLGRWRQVSLDCSVFIKTVDSDKRKYSHFVIKPLSQTFRTTFWSLSFDKLGYWCTVL